MTKEEIQHLLDHSNPQSEEALSERREHLHWVVDALVDGLLNTKQETSNQMLD